MESILESKTFLEILLAFWAGSVFFKEFYLDLSKEVQQISVGQRAA